MKNLWRTIKQIDSVSKVLPVLLAILTRQPRYLPEIKWSSKSWVHNIFRVYELIFWRKVGIRAESSTWTDGKIVRIELYTFEAICAHIETLIRKFFEIKWLDIRVESYQFAMAVNTPQVRIPWISFAIALDVSSLGATATSSPETWSHTCTGSNLLLVIGATGQGSAAAITSTYNSVSTTLVGSQRACTSGAGSLFYLTGPATGANTASVAWTAFTRMRSAAVSYSGVAQSGQPDAVTGNSTTGNNPSVTVTTVADNCWVVGLLAYFESGSATAGLTNRQTYTIISSNKGSLQDTNGPKTPAGNQAVNWTLTSANTWGVQAASFAPFAVNVTVGEMMAAINRPTEKPIFEQIGVVPY